MTSSGVDVAGERWAAPRDPLAAGYEVSDRGRVRRRGTGRLIRACRTGNYLRVTCTAPDGRKGHRRVHRLVFEAFAGPVPAGHDVDHVDGNPRNNALGNLQLLTRAEHNRKTARSRRRAVPRAPPPPRAGLVLRSVPAGYLRARVLRAAAAARGPPPPPSPLPRVEVSACGRVLLRDGRPLRIHARADGSAYHGYPQVYPLGTAHRMVPLHVLVAWTFYGPPPAADAVVHHRDDDRSHAAATNLEWTSQYLNSCHGRASHGQGVRVVRPVDPARPLGEFPCKREALRALGHRGWRPPAGLAFVPAARDVSVGRFIDPALAARAAARRASHSSPSASTTALGKRRRRWYEGLHLER